MNCAIVLSRLDSSRLPNKALLNLGGKRLIDWPIDALKKVKGIDIVLATSKRKIDDPLEALAREKGIRIFRGDLENSAKRVADCVVNFGIDNFARVNADSPFLRAELLEAGFSKIAGHDMVTNLVPRAYPYGISVEIFNSAFYLDKFKLFRGKGHYEHITSFFYDNIGDYNAFFIRDPAHDFHDVRLTVDTIDDLDFLNSVFDRCPDITDRPIEEIVSVYKQLRGK